MPADAQRLDNEMALAEEAAAWNFFHDLFRAPSAQQWEWLNAKETFAAWQMIHDVLGMISSSNLPLPAQYDEYEQTYIATFDVGIPAPPCPLIESHWRRAEPGPQIVHENLLYYRHFGLTPREDSKETADHLRPQMEFMAYVCDLQARLLQTSPADARIEQLQMARRDFVRRHLLSWIPAASAKLNDFMPGIWIAQWVNLLAAMVNVTHADGSAGYES